MKKFLIALALGLMLLAAIATTALADNGPHGGAAFANGSTDACAGCHRIHSAKSADGMLLVAHDIYALCTSCHDGTGAYTNVVDGYYTKTGWVPADHGAAPAVTEGTQDLGLFAGGFVNTRMDTTWDGRNAYTPAGLPGPKAVTDAHEVGQGLFAATGTLWGSGDVNTVSRSATLECTSCHDPHGNAGKVGGLSTGAPTASYRLLRYSPHDNADASSSGFETTGPSAAYFLRAGVSDATRSGALVVDVATKWYTPNSIIATDPTVAAYRTRWDNGYTPWTSIISGPGDMVGRYYIYKLPAVSAYYSFSSGTTNVSGMFTCRKPDGTLPALPAAQITTTPVDGVDFVSCGAIPATTTKFDNNPGRAGLGIWCSTCHDRYLATGARSTNSGDAYYMYRHTSLGTATGGVACVDCHVAHGASSEVYAQNGTNYSAAATINAANPENMLKLDNRGICLRCHGSSVNFQYAP